MLKDKINTLIADAMKIHDANRVNTLRLIKSELQKAETMDPKDPKYQPYNADVETKVLLKMVAAHKDSIKQFEGRPDLIEKEQAELNILQEFAPKEVTFDEIKKLTIEIINLIGNTVSMKDMKYILSKVQETYPTATGKEVSTILKDYINSK